MPEMIYAFETERAPTLAEVGGKVHSLIEAAQGGLARARWAGAERGLSRALDANDQGDVRCGWRFWQTPTKTPATGSGPWLPGWY